MQNLIKKIDDFQRSHGFFGYIYAVIKKYGDDNAGYQSALITYYGLLSLFPLLIIFTTVTRVLIKHDNALRQKIITSVTHYFPILGNQIQSSIHSSQKTGLILIVSILVTLYGARGGASAIQFSLSNIWREPACKRPNFTSNLTRSLSIIGIGGIGFILASLLSGFTVILGHDVIVKILATLVSILVIWVTLIAVFKLAIAGNKKIKEVILGAGFAAILMEILQIAGNAIIAHELRNLHSVYGTFALVIGLMFWIYLQAEVILYGAEIDVVKHFHLYPRGILQSSLTTKDKEAFEKYAEAEKRHKDETIKVSFKKNK
jgi:YihY family inner membrane protein